MRLQRLPGTGAGPVEADLAGLFPWAATATPTSADFLQPLGETAAAAAAGPGNLTVSLSPGDVKSFLVST